MKDDDHHPYDSGTTETQSVIIDDDDCESCKI